MIATSLKKHEEDGLTWYSFAELDQLPFLTHWITGRHGGFSKDGYGTLNLGDHVGDDLSVVTRNRALVQNRFTGGSAIYLPEQVHSADVITVSAVGQERTACDAVMADALSVPIGVLTADCLPIILADPVRRAAAVVHAGRDGVFKGITPATVKRMTDEYGSRPADLIAAIGPGIRDCCYVVGWDVFDNYPAFEEYLTAKKTLSLTGAVEDQLIDAGVRGERILDCGVCTSCRNEDFYSHRRQEGKAGRFMTGLTLHDPR